MKTLVIIDMQNDFIDGSLGTPEAKAIVEPMAKYISTFKGTVFYTQDAHFANHYLLTQEGRNLPIEHCIRGTKGQQLNPKISDAIANNHVACWLEKHTFGYPYWADELDPEDDGPENEIYICGVCTDICVIANAVAIKTVMPESKVIVLKNLCAGTTPLKHEMALEVMRSLQICIE